MSSLRRVVHLLASRSLASSSSALAPLVGRCIRASFMNIVLITPARSSSRSGNTTTGMRWARILRQLGHRVHIADLYDEAAAELMIAHHPCLSADSIRASHQLHPHP